MLYISIKKMCVMCIICIDIYRAIVNLRYEQIEISNGSYTIIDTLATRISNHPVYKCT
jgi:hypothetical protein